MEVQQVEPPDVLIPSKRLGTGIAFGTFGELLQGRLREEQANFLVTLPISCYSYAIFVDDPHCQQVTVFPPDKHKSLALTSLLFEHFSLPQRGRLILQSELPVGKGFASSSADLVATARAMSSCFHLPLSPAQIATFLCQVEPSDGVMYPGCVSFYHRQGHLREFLGLLPPLTIVAIDEGGAIDTLEFNAKATPFTRAEEDEYESLVEMLSRAIRQKDMQRIGQIATRSAILNQQRNPKHTLDEVIAICEHVQGLGVVVAHSGTCLGILLTPEHPTYQQQLKATHQVLSQKMKTVSVYHSLSVGAEEEQSDAMEYSC